MYRLALVAAGLGILTACGDPFEPSGVIVEDKRPTESIDSIVNRTSMFIDVFGFEGRSGVVVRCDENLNKYIKTDRRNGLLEIQLSNPNVVLPDECQIAVDAQLLRSFTQEGSGDVILHKELIMLENVKHRGSGVINVRRIADVNEFELESEGSGDVVVGEGAPYRMNVSLDGSGDVEFSNLMSTSIQIETAGSGDVFASDQFDIEEIEVYSTGSGAVDTSLVVARRALVNEASGSGNIEVYAASRVKVDLSGSSVVEVYGQPQEREVEISGSGEVIYR